MYPYENLLIKKLKGEIWKDVKGYVGTYQVSNFGRVKSLDRIIFHPRFHQQFIKGRLLKQKIVKDFNNAAKGLYKRIWRGFRWKFPTKRR